MKRKLWIVTLFALLAGAAYSAHAQAVVAYSFVCNGKKTGPCPDGGSPNSLIQASDGNFYGTAANSGDKADGGNIQTIFGGTVFSLTPEGTFKLLHTFTAGSNGKFSNGAAPTSLIEGPDGKLYGLTALGGNNYGDPTGFYGYGVMFRINKSGSGFQVIHRFCSTTPYCNDGSYSAGPLVAGTDGNIYGVTNQGGGGSGCQGGGCGTIFRVTPSTGAYQVVFAFSFSTGGGFPLGMTLASDGTFYGPTTGGLFNYAPTTGTFQLISLPFPLPSGCPGLACFGSNAFAFGANGNFYGLYTVYDAPGDAGLYEVEPSGSNFQIFPAFTTVFGGGTELLLASDGNLWVPRATGSTTDGDIITLSPSNGTLIQTLTPFSSTVFGPAEIIQATDGTLWGVGSGGIVGTGHFGGGTVFNVNAGLPPR